MISALYKKLRDFSNNSKGAVLILVTLLLLPMVLMLGLAVDSSRGLEQKRKLQMAADLAAKAGAKNGNGNLTTITSEAQKVFAVNTSGMTGITGPNVSKDSTTGVVTVSASIVVPNVFMVLAGMPTMTYSSTSKAAPVNNYGCIYAMNASASGALSISGASQVTMVGCGVYANSSNSSAVQLTGSAGLTTSFLNIVGNYSKSGAARITTINGITTGASPVANPIGTPAIPSYSSCTHTNYTASGTTIVTLNPGVYCGGITVQGTAQVTLNPGQYIIDGGSVSVGNSGKLIGNNVTLILTKKLSSSYATLGASGASTISLTAPTGNTSNPFNGIAIYQNPNAPTSGTNSIGNSVMWNVGGIIALPSQTLRFSGASFSTSPCAIIVANKVTFGGSAGINCPSNLIGIYMAGR